MGLFSKKQPEVVLPEEVSQYYASQRRERRGVAVFMGLTALALTFLIGLGLFWGGKYIVDRASKKDNKTSNVADITSAFQSDDIAGNGGNSINVTATETPTSTTSDTESNNQPSTSQTSQSSTEQIPNTGDEPVILPATGDEGH